MSDPRPKRPWMAIGGAIVLATFSSATARADDPHVSAIADALFRDGRSALQRGEYAEAVAKLEESQRLEPMAGTLLNLALAEEKAGAIVRPWEHARAVLDQLPPSDDRGPTARALFKRLDARVPRIVLRVKGEPPRDLVIDRDGTLLGAASLGSPLPIEPGPQRITLRASGHVDATYTVSVDEGARGDFELALGAPLGDTVKGSALPNERAPHSSTTTTTTNRGLRTAGYVALVAGVASLSVGVVSGGLAIARNDEVGRGCDAAGCDPSVKSAAREGRTFATLSNVTIATGALLAVGGLALVLFVPKASSPARATVQAEASWSGVRATLKF